MITSRSIAVRAALAIALMAGFYLFALAIAGALLAIPVLEVHYLGRVTGKLTLVAVVGGCTIIWSILPRRDRFEDPGPRLEPARHPRLFDAIREVARATGQAMPVEVFLVPNLNAWVAQRGGVMGFGSRRVMGLGLPLLEALGVRQLKAVLAHEFGHYHGGDTRLGPWIYVTRAAIGRSIDQLSRQGSSLAKPFEWYGNAFLRITHAVSRRQEFTADELAAQTIGAVAQRDALRTIYGASDAFDRYWRDELMPALQRGLRPPFAGGYRHYLGAEPTSAIVESSLQHALSQTASDPYDTHPSLAERLAALEGLPDGEPLAAEPRAIGLLEDVPELESRLIGFLAGPDASFEVVSWEETGERLWRPLWRERAGRHAGALQGITLADLPAQAADPAPLATRVGYASSDDDAPGQQAAIAGWLVGAATCTALADRGWTIGALPGDEVTLIRGAERIRPFSLVKDLAEGTLATGDWFLLCAREDIGAIDLGEAVMPPGGLEVRTGSRAWSFVAMEYHRVVLNRIYRVIVTEGSICGARVRGTVTSPTLSPGEAWLDPEFYPNPKLEARYRELEPGSAEFLAADPANFRYAGGEIAAVEFTPKKKWGMGNIPSSGRIILRLAGGGRRELILVGEQNGAAIRDALAPERSEAAGTRVA
ncbi:MAG TPA: M48 family metallopeptidase [Gemmatimonadales bacterium]|nr:M48 family metallopeptidase [Gemmatimonadales bacterium]